MAASNPFMEQSLIYQDLEKIRFSENLRKNASDYSQFVNDRVNQMTDEAFNRKRTAFQKAHIDLGRYMDMDHNASFYKTRNGDVDRIQSAISANNERIANEVLQDKDNTRRQFEINDYYYYNKLETLFFLQIFFISTLAAAVIMHGQKIGILTTKLAGLLIIALVAVVAIVGLSRYFYTSRTRDNRQWHRRYFRSEAPAPEPVVKCGVQGGPMEIDLNKFVPKSVTACGEELGNQMSVLNNALVGEMEGYLKDGKITQIPRPGICSSGAMSAGGFS